MKRPGTRILSVLLAFTMLFSSPGNTWPGGGTSFSPLAYAAEAGEDVTGTAEEERTDQKEAAQQEEETEGSSAAAEEETNTDIRETAEELPSVSHARETSGEAGTAAETAADGPSAASGTTSGAQGPSADDRENAGSRTEDTDGEPSGETSDVGIADGSGSSAAAAESEQTIPAELWITRIYDEKGQPTQSLNRVNAFWGALFGRTLLTAWDRYPGEYEPAEDELTVEISGLLPEGAAAKAYFIPFAEEEKYSETAAFALDLELYDADGKLYTPKKELQVTVGGRLVRETAGKEKPILAYSYVVNAERQKERKEYAADIRVFRDSFGEDSRRHYKVKQKKDAVIYTEDKKGLTVYTNDTFDFTTKQFPLNLIVAAQEPDRTLRADSSDGATEVEISGALSEHTSIEVTAGEAAVVPGADSGSSGVLGVDVRMADAESGGYCPDRPVSVSITDDAIAEAIARENDLELWQIPAEGAPQKVADAAFEENTVDFQAEGALSYVVVENYLEKTLTTTDGETYRVSVSYDRSSGIPPRAELAVDEIPEGTDAYDSYVRQSAEALGKDPGALRFAKAFDIRLTDAETGEEYQPNKDVEVSIQLLEDELNRCASVDVIHIHGEGENRADLVDSTVRGESVAFMTDGFSVYVLTGSGGETVTPQCTYTFYAEENGLYTAYACRDVQGRTVYSQTVTSGSELVIPQLTSSDELVFDGWYEGDRTGGSLSLHEEPYDFANITSTENSAVDLYAVYKRVATVVLHSQYDSDSGTFPVAYTRRAELVTDEEEGSTSASVNIGDLSATYTGSGTEKMAFFGWSETPITTPGAEKDDNGNDVAAISTDENGCIAVTGEKHLYPIFQAAHRLMFYSAQAGRGARYVSPATCFAGDAVPVPLPVTSMAGYTFTGWYTGTLETSGSTEIVNYGSRITNADGTLVAAADDAGVYIQAGKLYLRADTTLYAGWTANANADYRIVVWKQNSSDEGGLENVNRHYDDYAESFILSGEIGASVSVPQEYTQISYQGYTYSHCDPSKEVAADGSTVLNVYYNKNDGYVPGGAYRLTFADSITEGGKTSKDLPKVYDGISWNESIQDKIPETPVSGRNGYEFSDWYFDEECTIPANLGTMPDHDLTVYAGWRTGRYVVTIDPNYGALYAEDETGKVEGNGSGATWFWSSFEGEPIGEYTHVTRDYVESGSGTWYYVNHAGDGKGGNGGWPDRYTYYTQDPSKATEDTTFEYAPGTYTYIGWYEVYLDENGREIGEASELYDFSRYVDHNTKLRLHWKKAGSYYLAYDAGEGTLEDGTKSAALPDTYADYANVIVTRAANAPDGYTFVGWRVRGSEGNSIYTSGQTFTLHADDSVRVSGKDIVYLDAVYVRIGTARITYDANGGTLTEDNADLGEIYDSTMGDWNNASGVTDSAAGTAVVSGLANNTRIRLSSGSGFSAPQDSEAEFLGWSDQAVCDESAAFYAKDSQAVYAVNTAEPTTLYAVWGVPVTYELNSEDAEWGDGWDPAVYTQSGSTYIQTVAIGNTVAEPAGIPVYTGADGRLFRCWSQQPGEGAEPYDFSQPVTGALHLYACWSEPNTIKVHAVDASEETLSDQTGADGWTATDITVSTAETELSDEGCVEAPEGYDFAFAAVSGDISSVSGDQAVTAIKYDGAKKSVVVRYAGDTEFTALNSSEELYFVYYQKKTLTIQYKSAGADGTLQDAEAAGAPETTEEPLLGSYDMADRLSQPLTWAGGSFRYYAYAVGSADAAGANGLSLLTAAVSSEEDGSRPTLQVRNTWRGFEGTTDGTTWVSCGYHPTLYVIYFTEQPTVVTFHEKTVGADAVMDTAFAYHYTVTETTTTTVSEEGKDDVVTEETETVYDTAGSGAPCQLKDGEANSVILFYSETSSVEGNVTTKVVRAQTVTITQTEQASFATTVEGDGIEAGETLSGTCTAEENGGTKNITFTNTHKALPIEIHVAVVEDDGNTGGIIQRDSTYRTAAETAYRFDLMFGASEDLLAKLPADEVFTGDADTYAFGTVVCGSGTEGSAVTVANMGAVSIAYDEIEDGTYDLVLKDINNQIIGKLGSNQIYYLYYPMPKIRYVKETADGTLVPVTGSLPNEQTGAIEAREVISYNHSLLAMNGRRVEQNQGVEIPLEGFVISQSGNHFRMPPLLDDGLYERYLNYVKIGTGRGDAVNTSALDVSDSLTLQLRIQDGTLQYSFDGDAWENLALNGTPTIYAIYTERGYDLQISKTVDVSQSGENAIFSDSEFTVTITSSAITKDRYDAEGAENETIAAVPADGTSPGTISLPVADGSKIRIKGLDRGNYTITESGNENYLLTAKSGAIVGSSTSAMEVSDNTTVSLTLDTETRVDLTNSPKAICRIGDHYYYTLRSMVQYVEEMITDKTAEAEMLTDYLVPAADTVEIPDGCNITLTTADLVGHAAVLSRTADLADVPLFTNHGSLTLTSVVLEGNSVEASAPMIQSAGDVTIGDGAVIQNAVGGGAIDASAGDIRVGGTIRDCSAPEGGAIHHTGNGTITVEGTGSIHGNAATAGNGGAICLSGGTIHISGTSEITDNTAGENGGAIYAGNAVIEVGQGGSLTGNTAKEGGAICAETGTITISETVNLGVRPDVSGNTATAGNGGAIRVGTGSVTVSGGNISGNRAEGGKGGAIYGDTAAVHVSDAAEIKNNRAQNGGAIYTGSGNVTVSGGRISENTAADGSGGAVYADRGNVILSGENTVMNGNTAKTDGGAVCAVSGTVTVTLPAMDDNTASEGCGGAIFAGTGAVTVTGTAMTGNRAGRDGGVICADSGNVTVSGGSMSENKAETGNGGAICVGSGTLSASDSLALTGNEAGQNGGAVYIDSGAAALTEAAATGNRAAGGAAVYVNTGRATFSAGSYTGNVASAGGAIGVGSRNARLYFTGNIVIKDNTLGDGADAPKSNVYLNQDDDAVINIDALGGSASIGIYVPDDRVDPGSSENTKTLVDTRSVPGARFANYISDTNRAKITNDRFPALSVQSDTTAKKLYWGSSIKVTVRYLSSFSGGYPQTVTGVDKYTNNVYYPEFNDGALSELAAELNTKYDLQLTDSAVYACAFLDGETSFDRYLTKLTWDRDAASWVVTRRDGTTKSVWKGGTDYHRIYIYYSEPAYVSIENNSDLTLRVSDMKVNNTSVINSDTVAGYGMVFAKNGALRTALLPVSAEDMTLAAGQSINLLIPGGRNMAYTLGGSFDTAQAASIRLRRTGQTETALAVSADGRFETLEGRTLNSSGTYRIIFGDDKYICKVVDANGGEHPYSRISDAIAAIVSTTSANPPYTLKTAKTAAIEMLTDYLLPASDVVRIPRGYDITLTTAAKDTGTYRYNGEGNRATISRDSENTNPMITSEQGDANSRLTLKNLIIDGKSVRGSSAGGAVSISYFEVVVDTVDFINVYASNGGALYIDDHFNSNSAGARPNSRLSVNQCVFTNCNSTLTTGSRIGGGAIHFFGDELNLNDCTFTNCNGGDQAGAVFHRIDGNYNSWTTISGCTFSNCRAKAAGGMELDSKFIEVSDCTFEHCVATDRNGGGFNAYMANSASPAVSTDCRITLTNCSFNDCQAYKQNGGGFRSTAVYTTIINCRFTNTSGCFGGGAAMSNTNAESGEIYGCTFERCTAVTSGNNGGYGGGVASNAKKLIIGDYTYTDEAGEHTLPTTIANCSSTYEGGGLYQNRNVSGSTLTIDNAVITGNRTTGSGRNGGGVYTNARTADIRGSVINDNTCTGSGGGIYTTAEAVTIGSSRSGADGSGDVIFSSVSHNTAAVNGGGICHSQTTAGSALSITDAVISGNTSNNTNKNTDQGGGGVYAGVRTLTLTNATISDNTAKSHGGGILFEINDNAVRDVMAMTVGGCTLDGNRSEGNGGGIYTRAKTVEIRALTEGEGEDAVKTPTTISNCTAAYSGGGIYQNRDPEGSSVTVRDSVISGCASNDTSTDNNPPRGGGGIFANARAVSVIGSEIRNNTAVRNGGGIDAPINSSAYMLIVDHSRITGNTAGNQGGGIFTRSGLTLRNDTEITDNRLSTSTASNAAGVYLPNSRTLYVGSEGAEKDTVYVRENYTSDGAASNLRLWEDGTAANRPNNSNSVYVFCDLDGEIRVINAKTVGAQFGSSAITKPDGFSDDDSVFRADSSTLHGIIDRNDPEGRRIIWAGPPIAKITDGEGNLLYLKDNGTDPAIFDRLGTGNTGDNDYSSVAAFNMLLTENVPELYTKDGSLYTGGNYVIKMLDHYVTGAHLNVLYAEGRTVTLTTASKNETDGYSFTGSGTRATIIRGTEVNAGRNTLNVRGNLILENIVLDAGTTSGVTVGVNSRCIRIDNANCRVVLGENAILQNGRVNAANDGGGVYVNAGAFEIAGGVIRNCQAKDGGGVYKKGNQALTFTAGNIYECTAAGRGGAVMLNAGRFDMTGGTISGGSANMGGGVYVTNNGSVPFAMSGGAIISNNAAAEGGGIAVGGTGSRLYFSGRVNISGNTCDASEAANHACNVELSQNSNAVIHTNKGGLYAGSYIGVYVPGTRNDENPGSDTEPYKSRGGVKDAFGTFAAGDNTATFYSFVNDRNGLKGGIIENPAPNTIYWIQIFSLTVSKKVEAGNSTTHDPNEQFLFKVNIRGRATVSGQPDAGDIDSRNGEYGEMTFFSNGADTTTAVFSLKDGESVTGVNLSEGLTYEVIEYLTVDQSRRYAAMPMSGYSGATETLTVDGTEYTVIRANMYSSTIGENKSRTDIDPYTSAVEFKNIMPICKITDNRGRLLYQRYTWNDKTFYAPAVYTELTGDDGAWKAMEGSLYTSNGANPTSYSTVNGVQIQMLISEYTQRERIAANIGKVTLTTASAEDTLFPKQDAGTTSTIRRGFADGTMLAVDGDLTLATIILDGAKSSFTINSSGGIASVAGGGSLTILDGAVLQNAKTAEGYRGGAVYAAAGGTVAMSGGTINRNESAGEGAGIYLAEGSRMNLSGTPNFGGTGLNVSGNITTTNGNFRSGTLVAQTNGGKNYVQARQDIFVAESQGDPASISLNGNLDVSAGSIWIWAERENHYAMMRPFAVIEDGTTVDSATYAAFRNAQPDSVTNCGEDNYLSGSSGENESFIYWAGGFDISFRKVDGFGAEQSGAVFTLYTDPGCTQALKQGAADAAAVSADGTDTYKTKSGAVLDKGTVLLEQIPAGVYYMKETTVPEGYVNALTKDAAGNPVSNVYIVLVGDGAMQGAGAGVLADITPEQIAAQTGTGEDKKDAVIFRIDPDTGRASAAPDIAKYGIMNISTVLRKAILRKVSSTNSPLEGAVFEILRYDRTPVAGTDINGNTVTSFVSGANGVYFIDRLPLGTYYVHETGIPSGYRQETSGNDGNWFVLTVNEHGAGYEPVTETGTIEKIVRPKALRPE